MTHYNKKWKGRHIMTKIGNWDQEIQKASTYEINTQNVETKMSTWLRSVNKYSPVSTLQISVYTSFRNRLTKETNQSKVDDGKRRVGVVVMCVEFGKMMGSKISKTQNHTIKSQRNGSNVGTRHLVHKS